MLLAEPYTPQGYPRLLIMVCARDGHRRDAALLLDLHLVLRRDAVLVRAIAGVAQ